MICLSPSLYMFIYVLRECRVADAIKVFKCWVNGWATSHRYRENTLLPCLFGCSGCIDSVSHYLQCSALLALWRFLACGNASEDPHKMRFNSPDQRLLTCTSPAFSPDIMLWGVTSVNSLSPLTSNNLYLTRLGLGGPGAFLQMPLRSKLGNWL